MIGNITGMSLLRTDMRPDLLRLKVGWERREDRQDLMILLEATLPKPTLHKTILIWGAFNPQSLSPTLHPQLQQLQPPQRQKIATDPPAQK